MPFASSSVEYILHLTIIFFVLKQEGIIKKISYDRSLFWVVSYKCTEIRTQESKGIYLILIVHFFQSRIHPMQNWQ